VELWYALATSLNIPALEVLAGVGFDAAIERSVALLGIPKTEIPSRAFDRVYPLGLGTCSVRPVEMARAFAIFANGGREVTPIAIRSVEDRHGRVYMNPELDMRLEIQAKGNAAQVISPQNAFIMTHLLQSSARMGTLAGGAKSGQIFRYTDSDGKPYTLPASGKTGTTQDWGDAWTVGSSPYLTTAVWFGFDKKGNSLGRNQSGAATAGLAWGEFMRTANEDYPYKGFPPPPSGVVAAEVCSVTGLLLTSECGSARTTQYFLSGTQPLEPCTYHPNLKSMEDILLDRFRTEHMLSGAAGFGVLDGPLSADYSWQTLPALGENYEDYEELTSGVSDGVDFSPLSADLEPETPLPSSTAPNSATPPAPVAPPATPAPASPPPALSPPKEENPGEAYNRWLED
jgi:penicillin-binding protein 1A